MDDNRNRVQQRFGEFAQNYVSSHVLSAGYSLDRLIELVSPAPGKLALDIATGGGHVALALARQDATVIASDLTARMLRVARAFIQEQNVPTTFICTDALQLPFADETFDIVTTRHAPHHFPDVPQYARECSRVLRPGGVMGLVDHAGATDPKVAQYVNAFERLRDPSHVWEYSLPEWESFFVSAGLRPTHSEVCRLRLNFNWWTQVQHTDAETVLRLRVMLRQAPADVAAWLEPDMPDGGEASFTRWQVILIGVRE